MIYSNFLQSGTLGGAPETIARFPEMTETVGLLSEDAVTKAEAGATGSDSCAAAGAAADLLATAQYDYFANGLKLALGLLAHGDAVMLGVLAPAHPGNGMPV